MEVFELKKQKIHSIEIRHARARTHFDKGLNAHFVTIDIPAETSSFLIDFIHLDFEDSASEVSS